MTIGNIFLVGLMGSGKTTVGRALAKKLNRRFVDSDHEIEARTGASIPWIFEIEGEPSFRQREAEVIRDLSSQHGIVLATGGGAILQPESREYLKARGTVIYLRASVGNLVARTARDRNRPLLQTADPRARIEQLAREREPYYLEVADLVIDTGRPNVRFLVQSILDQLGWSACSNVVTSPLGANRAKSQSKSTMSESSTPFMLSVELGTRSYPILIGSSIFSDATILGTYLCSDHVAVVTNTVVAPLYLDRLLNELTVLGKQVTTIVLPDGEEEKTWSSLMRIFDALLVAKCDRKTTLIALGGGVVGDMTGFAAASYMRGVPFVQIPTTLLAQVDSSVGGKTGINHPLGKNMIGAFYQPQAVLADIETLETLPARELSAGLAEVIKYGAIIDAVFFNWIEANIAQLMARDATALTYAIRRSCEIKADVVRQDEREGGLRAILNFGHTFGHAIENGLGYGRWLHGEAVGCGMVMAADLSLRLGYIDVETKGRITALVQAARLPIRAPDLGLGRWLELMQVDKKNQDGVIRFILMKPLGTPLITTVSDATLHATLHASVD